MLFSCSGGIDESWESRSSRSVQENPLILLTLRILERCQRWIRQWKKGSEFSMMLDYFIRISVLTPHESWLWLVSSHCKFCITLIISIQYHICKVILEGYLPYYYPPFALSETPNTGPRNLLFCSLQKIKSQSTCAEHSHTWVYTSYVIQPPLKKPLKHCISHSSQ